MLSADRFTADGQAVLSAALNEARSRGHASVEPWHLLLALLDTGGSTVPALLDDPAALRAEAVDHLGRLPSATGATVLDPTLSRELFDALKAARASADGLIAPDAMLRGLASIPGAVADALDAAARHVDRPDQVVGRDREIDRVVQILVRRSRANPLLLGERGVGKSAIVSGLAQRIASGQVPDLLRGKRLLTIDPNRPIGAPDARTIPVLDGVDTEPPSWLESAAARQMIVVGPPALLERNPALERYFEPVLIEEPSVDDTIFMLRAIRPRYEAHHRVSIADSALIAAAALTHRHVAGRFLPAKAVDVLDDAAARLRVEIDCGPTEVLDLERSLRRLEPEAEGLTSADDARLATARAKLDASMGQWRKELALAREIATAEEDLHRLRRDADQAERDYDLARASKLRYGQIPAAERELASTREALATVQGDHPLLRDKVSAAEIVALIAAQTATPPERLWADYSAAC